MASTTNWFTYGLYHALNGDIDMDTDTIKVMLCTNDYTPNKNMHEHRDDITGEVEATGYTAGGLTVTTPALSVVSNIIAFDCDDPEWTITGTLTCRYLVFYVDTGDPETDVLLGYVDLGENVTTTDNIFRPVINENGLLKITNS